MHARVRALLKESEEWEYDKWGLPVSAAHLALASAAFSARLVQLAEKLGARFDSDDDREAFMSVWCYVAWLMGVPDEILFHSHAEGLRLFELGSACEPPPDEDAIALANCIINSAPVVIGVTEAVARADFAQYAYRIARELVGDAKADQLLFPPRRRLPILPWLRMQERLKRRFGKFFPALGQAAAAAVVHACPQPDRSRCGGHHVRPAGPCPLGHVEQVVAGSEPRRPAPRPAGRTLTPAGRTVILSLFRCRSSWRNRAVSAPAWNAPSKSSNPPCGSTALPYTYATKSSTTRGSWRT